MRTPAIEMAPDSLNIVRHGQTDWTLTGRYTGATDVPLTANGRREATSLAALLDHVLHGQNPEIVSSPQQRATQTATVVLPDRDLTVDDGLTTAQIRRRPPGWDIWSDGCPHGESTADIGHASRHVPPHVEDSVGHSSSSPAGTSHASAPPGPWDSHPKTAGRAPAPAPRSR